MSAAFEEGVKRLSRAVNEAAGDKRSWLDRVRAGLVAFLGFLDDEPAWGRLLLDAPVEDAMSGCLREQRVMGVLTGLLDDEAPQGVGERATGFTPDPALTAELVIGGIVSTVRARMGRGGAGMAQRDVRSVQDDARSVQDGAGMNRSGAGMAGREGGAFVELAPALMSFIVRPYLGQTAANRELTGKPALIGDAPAPAAQIPVRATRRTMLVLRSILRAPRACNREVAQAAGVSDEGQISKLLRRLERKGLIENVGVGAVRGEPNAWVITPYGAGIVRRIVSYYDAAGEAIAAERAGRARRR